MKRYILTLTALMTACVGFEQDDGGQCDEAQVDYPLLQGPDHPYLFRCVLGEDTPYDNGQAIVVLTKGTSFGTVCGAGTESTAMCQQLCTDSFGDYECFLTIAEHFSVGDNDALMDESGCWYAEMCDPQTDPPYCDVFPGCNNPPQPPPPPPPATVYCGGDPADPLNTDPDWDDDGNNDFYGPAHYVRYLYDTGSGEIPSDSCGFVLDPVPGTNIDAACRDLCYTTLQEYPTPAVVIEHNCETFIQRSVCN